MTQDNRDEPEKKPQAPSGDAPSEGSSTQGHRPLLVRWLKRLGISIKPASDGMMEWVQILAIAGLLSWFTISFITVRMWVPTGSMEPTIMPGDSFFIDRLPYLLGFKHPKPGDIVVFWHNEEGTVCRSGFLIFQWGPEKLCTERLVKRLIAVGGQTLAIRQGQIYIDGQPLTDVAFQRDYICDPGDASSPSVLRTKECSWTVPAGHFFVLGDNTRNSNDSRYWGFADEREFIGEPFIRVWPLSKFGPMNGYFGSLR